MKFAACIFLVWSVASAESAWTPEFALRFQGVGSVVPSPDGKWVVYTQTKAIAEAERSDTLSHVWLAAADGSKRIQLTTGEKSATNPVWGPHSHNVFFISDRSGKRNIYRIGVTGGEGEQITEFKGTMGTFAISPDAKTLAFTGYEPPADIEKAKKEKRDMRVVDADPQIHSIYIVPLAADADGKRPQTKILDRKYHVTSLTWSPDSKSIAFAHQPTPGADDWTKGDIADVDVASKTVRDLAATEAAENEPFYSPDGRYVAFTRSSVPVRWGGDHRIMILPRSGGDARALPATPDEQPAILGWTADSKNILFREAKRTKAAIYAMPIDGPAQVVYEPKEGTIMSAQPNVNGTLLGITQETPDKPGEAFVMPVSGGTPIQVSRANTGVPLPAMGKTEVIRWKSKDGLEVEGLLTYPLNYVKGQRYPLILNIHGGPTGVFNESFNGRLTLYPIAAFSERGYAVLRPNPRGSSGYGKQFRFANYNDWGGRDFEDDQTGVDKLIELGIADPEHLAVMGWSYGGFMTSWTITQTQRFKAAVIGAGVTDLWSFTGTADIPGFIPDYFGGESWSAFDSWWKHSPIAHVKNVKTPTLILHGEADDRVPISQGYEYYNALKSQGTLAKMVVYPRTPHGPREPKFVMDIMQRHIDWVEKYAR